MTSFKSWQALFLACLIVSAPALAEMEHRMGGLPGMPAHVLKPGGEFEHHQQFHPGPARHGGEMMFTFGQPGDPREVKRRIRIEARKNRFEAANLEFESRETVELACHLAGSYEAGMVVRVKVTHR